MTRTLIWKELRQHRLPFALMTAGAMLGHALILITTLVGARAGTPFEGLRLFLILIGFVSALLLCHRLVVVEYQARSQLFLEGLPVSRWRMVAVKFGLGLAAMLGLFALAFLAAWGLSLRREFPAPELLGSIALRGISVVWFLYSFCFLLGLTGRYRSTLYLAIFLGAVILADQTEFSLWHFGPIALLDDHFAYEAGTPPWEALKVTWLLSLVFMALTSLLSLIREGSVAALLAEKMSHRERVFIAALLVGLVWSAALLHDKAKKAPFDLRDAVTENSPGVVVKVAAGGGANEPSARRLARHLADEFAGARSYLGLESFPPVFITARRDLDANRYERGDLDESEGVHVHANFNSPGWSQRHFQTWLLREVLIVGSRGRAKLESKRWVLDGFPLFWTTREKIGRPMAEDKRAALRALYGTEAGLTAADLAQWLKFRERVGDEVAAGVAWSGLRTLARCEGPEACQRFLRRVLGNWPPKDARDAIGRRAEAMSMILREETGVAMEVFLGQWQGDLAEARRGMAKDLKEIPRLRGEVTFVPLSEASRKVRYRVKMEPAPANAAPCWFLHRTLEAFDEEVDTKSLERERNIYAEGSLEDLPESYSRGGRLYWTFGFDSPELGCQVISGWVRQDIP
jgi:hypothetical protein